MRRDGWRGFAVVLFVGVALLASVAAAGSEEDLAAIAKLREMEMASVNEGTADHVAMIYSADVEYVPPGEPALKGTDAVRSWMEGLVEKFEGNLEYTDAQVEVLGDRAIEQYAGKVTLAPREGGEAMVELVRGIHVYRRGEDGSWKITHDIWNNAPPPAPAE